MKSHSNQPNEGLPKDKVKDSKGAVLSPPSTSSSQKENHPQPHSLKEWPPRLEKLQRPIRTITSIASLNHSPSEILALSLPPVRDTPEYIASNRGLPRVNRDLAGRSSRMNGDGNINTICGDDDALPSPHPVKLDFNNDNSIRQSLPLTWPSCWSEGAEEDLVTHLGPNEQGRQDVMWEIVASEER